MSVVMFDSTAPTVYAPASAADQESWPATLGGVPLTTDPSLSSPPRRWYSLAGWDARGSRAALTERISTRPGATSSGAAWKSLTFTATVNLLDTQDKLYQFLHDLEVAVTLGPFPMSVDDPWGTWTRTVQAITVEQPTFGVNTVTQVFDLVAADPRKYGPAKSATVHAYQSFVTGVQPSDPLPWVFPIVSSGAVVVTNNGTIEAPVVFTIKGPCTRPSITFQGHLLAWNLTLPAGQQLQVDTDAHTSVLSGGGDVSALMIARDFINAPTGSSTAQFGALDATSNASLTAQWADTRP